MCCNKIHCGKASKTLRQGREVIDLGQYFAVEENYCDKVGRSLHQGREVIGEDSIVLLKTITVAMEEGHYIYDKRLQVEGSILLLKTIAVANHAGHCNKNERLQV